MTPVVMPRRWLAGAVPDVGRAHRSLRLTAAPSACLPGRSAAARRAGVASAAGSAPLPTAHFLLPTAYCLLAIGYWLFATLHSPNLSTLPARMRYCPRSASSRACFEGVLVRRRNRTVRESLRSRTAHSVVTSAPGRRRRGPGSRASCARPGMQAGKAALIWRRSACCTNTRLLRQSRSRSQRGTPPSPLAAPAGARQRAEPGSRRRRAQRRCLLPISYCSLPIGYWLLAYWLLAIGYSPPSTPQLIHARQPHAILPSFRFIEGVLRRRSGAEAE